MVYQLKRQRYYEKSKKKLKNLRILNLNKSILENEIETLKKEGKSDYEIFLKLVEEDKFIKVDGNKIEPSKSLPAPIIAP